MCLRARLGPRVKIVAPVGVGAIRGNVTARQATVGGRGNSNSWWVT